MTEAEKELNFIWGAPLCGQRRWMLRSAELRGSETPLSLCFSENDSNFESLLKRVELLMKDQGNGSIWVEWPSSLMYQDIELETWLAQHKDWSPTFTSILLEDSDNLNAHYREFYEEFTRATLSAVVVGRSELRKSEVLSWVGPGGIDFGKRLNKFEDDLWPQPKFERSTSGLNILQNYEEEYEEISFPIVSEVSDYLLEKVFEELSSESFGNFWGMDFLKKEKTIDDFEFQQYTLTPTAFYQTRSSVAGATKVSGLSDEVGVLRVAGIGLATAAIREYLNANELIQAS